MGWYCIFCFIQNMARYFVSQIVDYTQNGGTYIPLIAFPEVNL